MPRKTHKSLRRKNVDKYVKKHVKKSKKSSKKPRMFFGITPASHKFPETAPVSEEEQNSSYIPSHKFPETSPASEEEQNPDIQEFYNTFGQSPLSDALYTFVYTNVQEGFCMESVPGGNRLKDILCDFSLSYVPIPIGNQLNRNGMLVNGKNVIAQGVNGQVVDSGLFNTNHIVTKIALRQDSIRLEEVFINMVLLNTFIINGWCTTQLVPTYGIFSCPVQLVNQAKKTYQFCKSGKRQLFMVQKKIGGRTFTDCVSDPTFTFDQFIVILQSLFEVLLTLNLSEYRIVHGDLHGRNVMVEDNHVWLIDFGMSSFDYQYIRYTNHTEKEYDRKNGYHGGCYDLYFLMSSLWYVSVDPDIRSFCEHASNTILALFWENIDTPIDLTLRSIRTYEHLKPFRFYLYPLLQLIEHGKDLGVYEHNLEELFKNNYDELIRDIFITKSIVPVYDMNEYEMIYDEIKAKVAKKYIPPPDVFDGNAHFHDLTWLNPFYSKEKTIRPEMEQVLSNAIFSYLEDHKNIHHGDILFIGSSRKPEEQQKMGYVIVDRSGSEVGLIHSTYAFGFLQTPRTVSLFKGLHYKTALYELKQFWIYYPHNTKIDPELMDQQFTEELKRVGLY